MKKTDGSWFFDPHFCHFDRFWGLYGFIEKRPPQKALWLGPDPPPWDFDKIYRFLGFFWILGPSIEPEKASVKSASTPYPPWKVKIMGFFIKIYYLYHFIMFYLAIGIVFFLFRLLLLSFADICGHGYKVVFLCSWVSSAFVILSWLDWSCLRRNSLNTNVRRPPKRGNTGAVAGNLSLPEPRWV
jgi:hypothetical protein